MNLLANNDRNYFNARDLEHKKSTVSNDKQPSNKSKQNHISHNEKVLCNDVSTASYVRGYN